MLVYKTFKLRIYPNIEQAVLINKTLGCSCLVYNYFFNYKINLYKRGFGYVPLVIQNASLNILKDLNILKED